MDDRGFDAAGNDIVTDYGRDGHDQTEDGGEQSAADAGRQSLNIRFSRNRQFRKCEHDAPHGSEQAQKRTDAYRGCQENHFAFKFDDLVRHGLFQGRANDVDLIEGQCTAIPVRLDYIHLAEPEISCFANPRRRAGFIFDPARKRHRIAFRTEFFQKRRGVPHRAFQADPLVDHNAPGDHGKKKQDHYDPLTQHIRIPECIIETGLGQSGKFDRYYHRHFHPLSFLMFFLR